MKLLALLLLPVFSLAQDSVLTFSEVVEVPGQKQEQLFIKARQWLNELIKDSKEALQIADKETGELSGKGNILTGYKWKYNGRDKIWPARFNIDFSVYVKDGKYKYIFTNFTANGQYDLTAGWGPMTTADTVTREIPLMRPSRVTARYRAQKEGIADAMMLLAESLRQYMLKESKTDF